MTGDEIVKGILAAAVGLGMAMMGFGIARNRTGVATRMAADYRADEDRARWWARWLYIDRANRNSRYVRLWGGLLGAMGTLVLLALAWGLLTRILGIR